MSRYTSNISFLCPTCREPVLETIDVPETYWVGDKADDRYTSDFETVECTGCDTSFDLEVGNQDGTIFVSIEGHPEIKVGTMDAELSEPDDWDFDIPSEPALHIDATLREIVRLLDEQGSEYSASVLNRMIFGQQFAALEAYLGDTLLRAVIDDSAILGKIVAGDRELKARTLTLTEILADPNAGKARVIDYLQGVLYHNLPKVEVLYKIALGFDLFPSQEIKIRLNKAVPIRHDCVHRNGNDKNGALRNEVTVAFVRQVGSDILQLVAHVERQLN